MIRKIRIGILMHGIFYGGASRSLIQLLKILNKVENYEFLIYTTSVSSNEVKTEIEKYCKSIRVVNLKIITANQATISSNKNFNRLKTFGVEKFIKQLKIDRINILHINTTVLSHILKSIKESTDIKTIVHVRELLPAHGESLIGDYITEQIKSFSDYIFCISDNEAERFLDYKRKTILPNPIDFYEIDSTKSSFREQNGIDKETVIVTMSSHFYKQKGHLLFLESLKLLIEKYKKDKVLFLVVGFKPKYYLLKKFIKKILFWSDYLNEVKNKIKYYKLNKYTKLIPYTYNIFPILKDSDIVVRPALTADPWGRDIIEGMAMGKPIIATGSSTFYVKPGVTGYLVSPCAIEIAEKINELIEDKNKRELFGFNGRKIIEEMCDSKKYFQKIVEIYDDLAV